MIEYTSRRTILSLFWYGNICVVCRIVGNVSRKHRVNLCLCNGDEKIFEQLNLGELTFQSISSELFHMHRGDWFLLQTNGELYSISSLNIRRRKNNWLTISHIGALTKGILPMDILDDRIHVFFLDEIFKTSWDDGTSTYMLPMI